MPHLISVSRAQSTARERVGEAATHDGMKGEITGLIGVAARADDRMPLVQDAPYGLPPPLKTSPIV